MRNCTNCAAASGAALRSSTCLLIYQAPLSEGGERRLKVIRDTEDGFRISEEDLPMRGAGDLIGTAQSGLPRFRVADMERQAGLMAVAQSDARALLHNDPDLTTPRGQAARVLLWLLDQDRAIRLIGCRLTPPILGQRWREPIRSNCVVFT